MLLKGSNISLQNLKLSVNKEKALSISSEDINELEDEKV